MFCVAPPQGHALKPSHSSLPARRGEVSGDVRAGQAVSLNQKELTEQDGGCLGRARSASVRRIHWIQ